MKLYIRNMVCSRCKMAVTAELEKAGLHPVHVELGEAEIGENDIAPVRDRLLKGLRDLGFDLIDDAKSRTIEKIKNLLIDLVQHKNNQLDMKLSDYLSGNLSQDYSALSHLFSEVEGITIEKYYILQKIEKVKELLVYDELSLSEIAYRLNYSSVGYLSNQFKKVTGLTPSHFKNLRTVSRTPLEDL